MKRLWTLVLAGLCLLALAGCGGGQAAPFDPVAAAQALLDTPGVFTDQLEPLDRPILDLLYGLEGLEVTQAVCWCSTGATAEEVTAIACGDETTAKALEAKALEHIALQKEENESYRPQEMPKLEAAIVERRGNGLVVVVAADSQAARTVLAGI